MAGLVLVLRPATRLLRVVLLGLVGGGGHKQPPPPPQPPAAEAASRALLLLRPVLRAGLSGLPTAWLRRAQQPGVRVWAPPVPAAGRWDLSQTPPISHGRLGFTAAPGPTLSAARRTSPALHHQRTRSPCHPSLPPFLTPSSPAPVTAPATHTPTSLYKA
ncbi:hypothetical protein Pmani_038433 [Petrolisthes manimaculis]|uniref:Uncharacterized protein n=1 Tax=Petrolisthes manimaculis TaxID=1843537 RepID=A0AAE1NGC7_9EUCA|nr:hypothetical protein Pmani_038433 [Petrolisthes manimaculis]